MSLKLIVTRDFNHMSDVAAEFLLNDVRQGLARAPMYSMGLATGNTPTGVYDRLVRAANNGTFDAARIRSFNLDEYIGLPGDNAQQRALHPESYSFFMIANLFGRLDKKFAETCVPWGALVDVECLDAELKAHPDSWEARGTDAGTSIVIKASAKSNCLRWIRGEILEAYERRIAAAGGIDLQIIGVGQKGHVGFHEAGIPFEDSRMLLVKLDDNTVSNAILDGHFPSRELSPTYAVSMGAELIYRARTVLLLANGERKTDVIAQSLLHTVDCSVPLSYGQRYAENGGNLVYVVDRVAAAKALKESDVLRRRGVVIEDRS